MPKDDDTIVYILRPKNIDSNEENKVILKTISYGFGQMKQLFTDLLEVNVICMSKFEVELPMTICGTYNGQHFETYVLNASCDFRSGVYFILTSIFRDLYSYIRPIENLKCTIMSNMLDLEKFSNIYGSPRDYHRAVVKYRKGLTRPWK